MKTVNQKIIDFHKRQETHTLSLKNPDESLSKKEQYERIKIRLKHLSKLLFTSYEIYRDVECPNDLYGRQNGAFLAFVGDKIVRQFPFKDLVFNSEKAINADKKGTTKEHWTPISFFRNLFFEKDLTEQDFYDALLYYYRVVIITQKENDCLNSKGHKTTRPVKAYEDCGIKIYENDEWEAIYGDYNKFIK